MLNPSVLRGADLNLTWEHAAIATVSLRHMMDYLADVLAQRITKSSDARVPSGLKSLNFIIFIWMQYRIFLIKKRIVSIMCGFDWTNTLI